MSRKQPKKVDPLEQLHVYNDRVQRLKENELSTTGFGASFTLNFDNTGDNPSMTTTIQEPRRDLLTGFLGVFRQFINNNEQINQYKIFKTLHLCLTDEQLKSELVKARADWSRLMKGDGMSLIYNGKVLTPIFLTDMWINDALHSDIEEPEKEAILKHMLPHERGIMRVKFFNCVHNACRIIAYVDFVITKARAEGLIDVTRYR
ncbi:MAG: hypothetical protein AABO57_20300 [Acidobacteriota bacterium]